MNRWMMIGCGGVGVALLVAVLWVSNAAHAEPGRKDDDRRGCNCDCCNRDSARHDDRSHQDNFAPRPPRSEGRGGPDGARRGEREDGRTPMRPRAEGRGGPDERAHDRDRNDDRPPMRPRDRRDFDDRPPPPPPGFHHHRPPPREDDGR